MFWASIASLINGFATIVWKKAMTLNTLGKRVFFWMAFSAGSVASVVLLSLGMIRLP